MSDVYRLLLRADPSFSAPLRRADLRQRLARIPTLVEQDAHGYRFGEPDEHGVMEIEFQFRREGAQVPADRLTPDEAEIYHALEVRIPRAWVMSRGPQVFALVFMAAEWAGWPVWDPQIEDTLQKDVVLQGLVAMRQARLEKEGRGGPPGTQAHFVADRDRNPGDPSGAK